MKNVVKVLFCTSLLLSLFGLPVMANEQTDKGQSIAFDRKKGNCLACHYIKGGTLMGNAGPALVSMKQRFPKRADLISQITEPRKNNPKTIMPPFGTHEILSKDEIDLIVTWLYTL